MTHRAVGWDKEGYEDGEGYEDLLTISDGIMAKSCHRLPDQDTQSYLYGHMITLQKGKIKLAQERGGRRKEGRKDGRKVGREGGRKEMKLSFTLHRKCPLLPAQHQN